MSPPVILLLITCCYDLEYSPVAVLSLVLTCTVSSVASELLRTSTARANPSFSLMMYTD